MGARLTLYGIPNCGTVKKARRFLEDEGVEYRFVDLREAPPSAGQVKSWVAALGAKPLRNTSGGSYRALGPEKADYSDGDWTQAFAADPMLLKRPVVERAGKAVAVGFKESVFRDLL